MSGTYQNWSADSPGGLNESTAAIRDALAQAMTVDGARQTQAAQFIQDNGHAVSGGHPDVGQVAPHDVGRPA
jgi:hypothetical protein